MAQLNPWDYINLLSIYNSVYGMPSIKKKNKNKKSIVAQEYVNCSELPFKQPIV